MIADTVFFYLIAAWYVIEGISTLSLIAATVTYIIYPVKNSKEKKHD
jgi:hypothetical protein